MFCYSCNILASGGWNCSLRHSRRRSDAFRDASFWFGPNLNKLT